MRLKQFPIIAVVLAAVAVFPLTANAAPQILGLVATTAPLPLQCIDGICSVEVSGVCLQEHRPAPVPGTAYRPAEGSALTLVVKDRHGASRTLAVAEQVAIRSARGFNSLKVSLPETVIRNMGGEIVQAALSVAPLTSLVPVVETGDPSPLTETEIRETTGRLREIAETAFGQDPANLSATRILNQMINQLPTDTAAGAERIAALRERTMAPVVAAERPRVAGLVNRALSTCREKLRVDRTPHLRACIANQHDILNSNTTQYVWRSLRPGS